MKTLFSVVLLMFAGSMSPSNRTLPLVRRARLKKR